MSGIASWLPWPRAMSVRIEPLETRHAARLAALHGGAFGRGWTILDFERLLAEANVQADGLFLERRREPDGFVLSRRAADEAEILSIALSAPVRGRGYARSLLTARVQTLSQAGVRTVHLEVEEGNAPALALYHGLGFREAGRRPAYYAKADGSRACALILSLAL
jgi:[ribosomal protein S18]-alanine N-acetyltransferase